MTDNIIRFKDKKKLQLIIDDLTKCLAITNELLASTEQYKIYSPVIDLVYQAYDTRTYLLLHIERIKKEMEE